MTNALRLRGWKPQRVSAPASAAGVGGAAAPASAAASGAAPGKAPGGAAPGESATNPTSTSGTPTDSSVSSGVPTAPNASAANSRPATSSFPERRLRVEGMKCHKCAGRVRGALEAVPGVESAVVDLEGKQAMVRLNDSVPDEMLVGAVIEKGFEAEMLSH